MTRIEVVARPQASTGHSVERLLSHPRLPLLAALDAERPAVHIWTRDAGRLRGLASLGAESTGYGTALGWERSRRTPAVTWHPHEPLLLMASEDGVVRWTPSGPSRPEGPPPAARYRGLAFSPNGQTLWASPSSGDDDHAWQRSDVLDLDTGVVSTGPRWDTGVTEHPGGGLVATLASDQGATLGLFARIDPETRPATMRVQRRALILDADGYQRPIFSADGRHLAIRGNAYENSLDVFEFPSLRRVLATTLGEPCPDDAYTQEWLDQTRAWSRQNIAFDTRPGVLWIGTPTGTLVEVDIHTAEAVEHDTLAGTPVAALDRTATGELAVARGTNDLVLLSVNTDSPKPEATGGASPQAAVEAFLAATSEVPDDGDPWTHLVTTDGTHTWESDDLNTVTTASATDPTWLRLQAAINTTRAQATPGHP